VVHYGCIDDSIDIIESKLKNNTYLHTLISEKSKSCVGIDLNSELITTLKTTYSINNIFYGDVENPETFQIDLDSLKKAEVLLIPDIIEHLNNPGLMLKGVKKYFSFDVKILILTPNPFTYLNFVFTLLGREIYNIYHTCYFSTNNMKVLLSHYNIKIKKVYPCFLPKDQPMLIKIADKAINILLTIFSFGFCDNYLYECEFEE
jgi:hypothetical protein